MGSVTSKGGTGAGRDLAGVRVMVPCGGLFGLRGWSEQRYHAEVRAQ